MQPDIIIRQMVLGSYQVNTYLVACPQTKEAVIIDPGAPDCKALGLATMTVLPEFQNKGIGSKLVQAGLEECRETGIDIVVVLGHPKYYPRFGFVPAQPHGINWEHEVPQEAFMVKELRGGALAGISGTVKFRPEFDAV